MRNSETVTFGGGGKLDRCHHLRGDQGHLETLLSESSTAILPFWRGKPLISGSDPMIVQGVPKNSEIFAHAGEAPVLLGQVGTTTWFVQDVSAWEPETGDAPEPNSFLDPTEQYFPGLPENHRFAELRQIMTRLSPQDAEIAAAGRAILEWHRSHRFCARCGAASEWAMAGWQRDCPACGAKHFPRTDPVVIMLITHGNSVLVGRSPGWPEGMYSLLAGFIDPGETIEAAVRREVFEEAGVRVGKVGYLASQPWPFPASLMIGCRGEAVSADINIDPQEIEDAIWLTREEMLDVFAGHNPKVLPARRGAIAHFLLENWLKDTLDE